MMYDGTDDGVPWQPEAAPAVPPAAPDYGPRPAQGPSTGDDHGQFPYNPQQQPAGGMPGPAFPHVEPAPHPAHEAAAAATSGPLPQPVPPAAPAVPFMPQPQGGYGSPGSMPGPSFSGGSAPLHYLGPASDLRAPWWRRVLRRSGREA